MVKITSKFTAKCGHKMIVITQLHPYYKVFVTQAGNDDLGGPLEIIWHYDCELPRDRDARIKYLYQSHVKAVKNSYEDEWYCYYHQSVI